MALSQELLTTLNTTEDALIAKLIHDVKEIFSSMLGLEDLLHLPLQIDPVSHFNDCVSALVGLAGTYNGLVSLHMPSELAIKATSSMLGMDVNEINDDVNDAMGEIANMIAGSFKMQLSKSGTDVHLSTPSVVCGKEYIISLGSVPEQVVLRFATDEDWFVVAVAFDIS